MHTVSGNRESNGGKREGAGRKRGAGAVRTQEISKAFIETNQKTPLDIILIAMTRAHNEMQALDPSDPQYAELETRAVNMAVLAAPYIHAKLASVASAVTSGVELIVISGVPERTH
jgi:hypothetical protein